MKKIVLATRNSNKIKEIKEILGEDNFEFYTLESGRFSTIPDIPEDGKTFEENAMKKAQELFSQSGIITVSDDSGLEVEALGGNPGVKSARYAGPNATSEALCKKLLREMQNVPEENRKAKFVCCVAIINPDGDEKIIRGETEGIILNETRGDKGFGYDPVFYYPPQDKTFAEMTMEEKNKISHRFKAFSKAREELLSLA